MSFLAQLRVRGKQQPWGRQPAAVLSQFLNNQQSADFPPCHDLAHSSSLSTTCWQLKLKIQRKCLFGALFAGLFLNKTRFLLGQEMNLEEKGKQTRKESRAVFCSTNPSSALKQMQQISNQLQTGKSLALSLTLLSLSLLLLSKVMKWWVSRL